MKLAWCAIGDSFTYLNDHLEETGFRMGKGYLDQTAEALPFEVELINLGINGSTTADWIQVPIPKADFYTILLGTNDWFHNEQPTGTKEDFSGARKGTILGNLGRIVRNIRVVAPDAPVFIMNPVERGDFVYLLERTNQAHGSYAPEGGRYLKDLAYAIWHDVRGEHIIPIDLHDEAGFSCANAVHFKRTSRGDLAWPDYVDVPYDYLTDPYPYPPESIWYTYDGLHPSEMGCRKIADVLSSYITEWFVREKHTK